MDINQAMEDFIAYAIKNPPVYIAFVFVCLVIIIGLPLLSHYKVKQAQFRVKDPKGNLTTKQQQAINVGAIMGAMFGDYCNSLRTKKIRSMTTMEGWGIHSPGDARETISQMITGECGHRVIFDQIKECIDNENNMVFESKRNKQFAKNLRSSIPLLIKEQVISTPAEIPKISALAWDMGRLVNISRWSYDLKYITEEEAWKAIYIAYEQVLGKYDNWQEFAQSYLVGRAMWGGTAGLMGLTRIMKLKTIIQITKRLLKHSDSPWNLVPFK